MLGWMLDARPALVLCACALVLPLLAPGAARAADQPAETRTLAGTGAAGNADGPAKSATFMLPTVVRYGPDGVLYVLDTAGQRVRAIAKDGVVSTVAGSGAPTPDGLAVAGAFADGEALKARFDDPMGMTVGPDGAVYVADTDNRCIRRIKGGIVSVFAGKPGSPGHEDGSRLSATFFSPQGIAFDKGGVLWVADNGVGLRRIRRDGLVETMRLLPNEDKLFFDVAPWGSGRDERLYLTSPSGITVYDPTANFTQVIRDAPESGGTLAPYALALLGRDRLLAVDPGWNVLRYVRLARPPTVAYALQRVVAGSPLAAADVTGGFRDGPPAEALFSSPTGLAVGPGGEIAIADAGNRRVRLVPAVDARGALEDSAVPSLEKSEYNVLYVGNSFAFWNSLWDDSVAGIVERGLNARRAELGIPRHVKVTVARFDGSGITAQGSFIREAIDARPDLVVWSFNSFDIGAEETQYPARHTEADVLTYLTAQLRDLRTALHAHGIALVAAAQPVGIGVAPTEATFGKLTIATYRPFESGLASERRVERAIKLSEVPAIPTLDAFVAEEHGDRPKPLYESTRGGFHFTPAGNAFYAAQLLRGLERLRPWAPAP
jgi:hypothetical protein